MPRNAWPNSRRQRVRKEQASRYSIDSKGCWNWLGITNMRGYAWVTIDNKPQLAYRWFCQEFYKALGPLPSHVILHHICKNKICVNPSHLLPTTHAVNIQSGGSAKLIASDVLAIRRAYAAGTTQVALAAKYGIGRAHVCDIVRRKSWSNLPNEQESL